MISKKTSDFANTISFTVKNDSAFGFIDDFLISVYEIGSKKAFFIYYLLDTEIPDNDGNPVSIMTLSNILSDVFSKYEITEYSHKENGLEILCSLSYKNFYSLIKATAKELSKVKSVVKNVCSECGVIIDKTEKRYRISNDNVNCMLCSECANTLLKDAIQEDENIDSSNDASEVENTNKDTPTKNHSTLKGIGGSVLFSFGISICFILLYAFVIPLPSAESSFKSGYYVNWITALMAFASFMGFRIFSKESISNKQIFISGGISVAFALVSQYISSLILFSRESILTFENLTYNRFSKMIPYLLKMPFTDKYVGSDFKIYVLMDLIFIVIALLVISFFLSPKNESETVIEEL